LPVTEPSGVEALGGGRLPDFFVIGAPRSGTTSLYRYLQEHPQIYMSSYKEPSFFAVGEAATAVVGEATALADDVLLARSVLTWDDYRALFSAATADQVVGEASPTYLYADHVPGVVARHCPDARIIASLRQPVDRAFSHLTMANGGRPVTVDDLRRSLEDEAMHPRTALQDKADYLRPGFYALHLARWLERFGPERVHTFRYELLAQDTAQVVAGIHRFLGVDPSFTPDVSVRYLQSGHFSKASITRATRRVMPYAQRFVRRLPDGVGHRLAKLRARVREAERTPTGLTPTERTELTARYYADDIAALQDLTGDDYGSWLA
jgi:hypothetical protein